MFPWVILQLWSQAWAFSVLFGAKTPTELVSVFVVLHCQSGCVESVQKQDMKALNTHTYTYTHKICLPLSDTHIHTQTHTVHLPFPTSNTHIHKYSLTDTLLWSYILFAVSGCAGSLWMHLRWSGMCARLHQCVRLSVCRRSLSVHSWSPKSSSASGRTRLVCTFESVLESLLVSYK